ncbi:MAG: lysozyme [Burkholderiales bacterium]
MIQPRTVIAALTLSASALVGIALNEGYVDTAYVPVKGDVLTIGYGNTQNVHVGDKTTPTRALVRLLSDANSHSEGIKRCITSPLYQYEFDAYSSLAYNIGVNAFCTSTLVIKLNSGDYAGACKQVLRWDKFHGKPLPGLTKRRLSEYKTCIGQ